jgi:hypothetical protein
MAGLTGMGWICSLLGLPVAVAAGCMQEGALLLVQSEKVVGERCCCCS